MHQKYVSDTAKKTDDHANSFLENQRASGVIDKSVRGIALKKSKIELMKSKIIQHSLECNSRNQALKKEKEHIQKNYHDLKL